MSRLVLPLALLLLLCGGLFFFLNGPQEDAPNWDEQSNPAEETEAADSLGGKAGAPVAANPKDLDQVKREEGSANAADLGSRLADAGKGLLKLRVVGRQGQAADGVEVELLERHPATEWGGFAISERAGPAEAKATMSAVDGFVSFEVEAGQDWSLRATGGHWGLANLEVSALRAGEIVDLGAWRLEPADQIRGVVRDPQGEAVAQAQVILTASGNGLFDGAGRVQVQTSDTQGLFVFEGVAAGRYKVEARATGYQLGVVEPIAAGGQGEDLEIFVPLQNGRTLQGVVLDPDNQPIADAIIQHKRRMVDLLAHSRHNTDSEQLPAGAVTSDANGRFVMSGLAEDPVSLRISAPGFAATTVTEQLGAAEMVARLKPTLTLAGVLLLPDGSPAASQELSLMSNEEGFGMVRMPGSTISVTTDVQGHFLFESVSPGDWTPHAVHPGGQLAMPSRSFVASEEDLRWQMEAAQHLIVRVLHDGKPVAGAQVRMETQGYGDQSNIVIEQDIGDGHGGGTSHRIMGGEPPVRATADAFGYALLPGVSPGAYELKASASGFATQRKTVERREGAQELEVELEAASQLRVFVRDTLDEPVAGVAVVLRALDAAEGSPEAKEHEQSSDAAGRAVWSDLPSGRYELAYRAGELTGGMVFSIDGMGTPEKSRHVVSVVELQAEDPQEMTITVDALATVEILATRHGQAAAGVEVWLEEELADDPFGFGGKQSQKQWTDEQGRARLAPVGAGSWSLVARGSADAVKTTQSLTLQPGHQQADIEIAGATLSGILMGAQGPLAGAKVSLHKVEEGDEDQPRSRVVSVMVMDNGDGEAMEMGMEDGALARAVTAADGSFLLRDLPAGSWQLEVRAKGYAKWSSEPISINQHQDRNLGVRQLVAECSISGVDFAFDTDASGPNRFSGISLIELEDEQGGNQGIAMPQSDGSFRFGGLAPGKYRVTRGSYRSDLLDLSPGQQLTQDLPK